MPIGFILGSAAVAFARSGPETARLRPTFLAVSRGVFASRPGPVFVRSSLSQPEKPSFSHNPNPDRDRPIHHAIRGKKCLPYHQVFTRLNLKGAA